MDKVSIAARSLVDDLENRTEIATGGAWAQAANRVMVIFFYLGVDT
jgi:hypothetical protein